jgi:hypothetical protein
MTTEHGNNQSKAEKYRRWKYEVARSMKQQLFEKAEKV